MCTAVTYKTKAFYFGRTLDLEFSYHEEVTVTPRNFPLHFRALNSMETHYAMIGMAHVAAGYPLYYDAVNEKGLAMAGLNFVGYASYNDPVPDKHNVAQFELIPWILGQCTSVKEARRLAEQMNITNTAFSDQFPPSQLHWIIADREECITVESTWDGLRIFTNPVGVLANNPPFDQQMFQLNNYMHLSAKGPENHFSDQLIFRIHSRGMGALGLPGDLTSQSRFVRAAFVKMNSVSGSSEAESVSQFFHILGSVDQQRGCCELPDEKYVTTVYTSCANTDRGIYYYTTYDNHQITGVDMHRENLDGQQLIRYPLILNEQIHMQN